MNYSSSKIWKLAEVILPYAFIFFSLDQVQKLYEPFYRSRSAFWFIFFAVVYLVAAFGILLSGRGNTLQNLKSKRLVWVAVGYAIVSWAPYALMHNFAGKHNISPVSLVFLSALGGALLAVNFNLFIKELPAVVTRRIK